MKLFIAAIYYLDDEELIQNISVLRGMTYSTTMLETVEKGLGSAKNKSLKIINKIKKSNEVESKEKEEKEVVEEINRIQKNIEKEKNRLKGKSREDLFIEFRKELGSYAGINEEQSKDDDLLSRSVLLRCAGQLKIPTELVDIEKVEELVFRKFLEDFYKSLEEKLSKLNDNEIDNVKKHLQDSLDKMSKSEIEAIKDATNIEKMSADELMKFMKTAVIGGGTIFALHSLGFGLYLALSTMLSAVSLAIGVTFSFGVYTALSQTLWWMIGPLAPFLIFSLWGVYGWIGKKKFKNQVLVSIIVSLHARLIEFSLEGILRKGDFEKLWIDKIKSKKDTHKNTIVIRNENHLDVLKTALNDSKSKLYIYSGWLNVAVIEKIKKELEDALNRGIEIFIGYGWESPSGNNQQSNREKDGLDLIKKIIQLSNENGKIICERFPNHSKILICDTQYAICGSANWMSNTGYYNREVSIKIEEPGLIKDLLSEAEKDFVN